MMNELQIFNSPEFGSIRGVLIDNEPYFVGKDVAYALGYSNSRDALKKHVDDEDKGVAKCDTLGGTQDTTIINESGVYSLIFGSKLQSAKKFKHWVTSEVLPALRKNGTYSMGQQGQQEEQNVSDDAEITTDQFIRISEIVGNCPKSNRPYVLNILRHIIPDIDELVKEKPIEETKPVKRPPLYKQGVPIDVERLQLTMNIKHISKQELARRVNVSTTTVSKWLDGETRPVIENRVKICIALGEDENFLTPKRKRNVRKDEY